MASTEYDEATLNSFRFDAIGVVMALRSIILNLFSISTAYFPCAREILFTLYHISMSRKYHTQVLYLELVSKSPSCNFNEFHFFVMNKSSTYNRSITGLPPSTLKQRLESALLSVKPRVISNLSILSYHVEPYIFYSHSL